MSNKIGLIAFALIVTASMVTIASIDLLLPAVPLFPEIFNTTVAASQYTVASFTFGAAIGFLLFGTLGVYFNRARLLWTTFALFGLVSLACAFAKDITTLAVLRGIQGLLSTAPGVFAPAMINAIFDERRAMRAMSLMGSVQSLAPGLAPIIGLWLLDAYGWKSSFYIVTAISLVIATIFATLNNKLPMGQKPTAMAANPSGYLQLLKNLQFWRFGLSRSLVLGGLVAFMLSAPAVFVNVMGLTMHDFIIVQASGIAAFFITTNLASQLDRYFSLERIITPGIWLGTLAAVSFFTYTLMGGTNFWAVWAAGVVMNVAFGMFGNISFFLAIKSAKGDDTRASAVAVLWILFCIAGGTALCAPFITAYGLMAMGAVAATMHVLGLSVFYLRKAGA